MKAISTKFNSIVLAATFLTGLSASAQSPVDVGLFDDGNNNLEIRVKPNSNFDGIFSSVVFTVRWDNYSGATLGDPIQLLPEIQYIPIQRSGDVINEGSSSYQVYAGFGMQPMSTFGVAWDANEEVVIARIPVTGNATFEVINDSWTGEITNNGDYYVSLGGLDKTGVIYGSATGIDENDNGFGVSIQPNPNNGLFSFVFNSTQSGDYDIELVNTLGQTMYKEKLNGFVGSFQKDMDLTEYSNGLYYLKISDGTNISVHKVIYK